MPARPMATRSTVCWARTSRTASSKCRRRDSCNVCSEVVNEPLRLPPLAQETQFCFDRQGTPADHRRPRAREPRPARLSAGPAGGVDRGDPQVRAHRPGPGAGGAGKPGHLLDPRAQHHPARALIRAG
ncbi:hypothetical protein OF001_U180052 [Pseudomonas sp. OF001]|nr:hypothetical protein OF001_U180052 [Pseudomonas sp. OF001]